MDDQLIKEESAPVQGNQEPIAKDHRVIEAERVAYIKHMRKQNDVLEEDVRFMKLSLESFTLKQRIADINKQLAGDEVVRNAKTSFKEKKEDSKPNVEMETIGWEKTQDDNES